MSDNLTDKQRAFVEEYLIDLNATQAAIRAGYSVDTAGVIGSENLQKHYIQEAIKNAQAERSKRTGITQDMVLAELARCGFSNIGNYVHFNESAVEIVDSSTLSEDATRCIAEVSQTVTKEGGSVKFKLHDKVSALDKIARHLGMYTDTMRMTGVDGGPVEHTVRYVDAVPSD